jgi:hypothetical protein
MKHIKFERNGGFMGRKVSLDLDLEQLPPEQVQALMKLVVEADFFNLQPDLVLRPIPDGFTYNITIEMEEQQHSVRFSDTTSPASLQPLLEELSKRTRPKPKHFIPPTED